MVNTSKGILDKYIVLKKYINDKEHKKIEELRIFV